MESKGHKPFKCNPKTKNIYYSGKNNIAIIPQPRCKICGRFIKVYKRLKRHAGKSLRLCNKCKRNVYI